MVDGDPQGSLSSWLLNGSKPRGGELSDVLFERRPVDDCLVQLGEGLYLLPSFLSGDLRAYAETKAGSEPYAFKDLCARLEERFQIVMVDLAPGLGTFEQSAIAAMDRALLVLEPEFLSVEGLGGLLDDIEAVTRKRHAQVRYDWLVANRVNAGFARHRTYLDALGERWKDYRLFLVRQGAAVSEAQTVHEPLAVYAPKDDRALPGYQEIAEALKGEI